jgi:hypothetical protein
MSNLLDKRDRSLSPMPGGRAAIDKADKYRWARPTSPGEFRLISKSDLNLDDRYQRGKVSETAVRTIAAEWDWTLFGVIKVAERPDLSLWVFDGGHRVRAAFYRSDISQLPSMVFQLAELSDEARAFIAGARMSHRINSLDTFRAASVAEEPGACRTASLLSEFGITVQKNVTTSQQLKCVHTIQRCVEEDSELAKRLIGLSLQMANEKPISGTVFRGLFTLVRHYNGRDILTEFADTFARLTQDELDRAIRQLKAELGKGGEIISAKGIVAALNKGKKTKKLVW